MPARPVLLTVDDDRAVSRAVARDLRRHYGDHYRIVRGESGRDALAVLRERRHGGSRRYTTGPEGTTFCVRLPLSRTH